MKCALPSKNVNVLFIPERVIKYVQPPNVFFFRQYQIYVRRTEDHVRVCLHDSGMKLHDHSFVMKMHSVVCYQLGAPAYTYMLLHAWKKPGYAIHKTCDVFVNTIAVSFNFGLETCLIDGYVISAFIRCSYYTRLYCFKHFIPNPHLHIDADHNDDMSLSRATIFFAIALITFNKHF
jgi:hypothetical protein